MIKILADILNNVSIVNFDTRGNFVVSRALMSWSKVGTIQLALILIKF